jgi:arabinofuranosyltransferase
MRMIFLLRRYSAYWPLVPVLLIGLWFAHHNLFMQDDAFISYRYAKYFAQGHGLVWYPGSTEFGYTNFFYTFMIGVVMLFHLPPDLASDIINHASFVGCLCLTYAMAVRLLDSRWIALLPVLLLATHHSFTSYASGGLETMWVSLLILTFYYFILNKNDRAYSDHYIRLGSVAAVALLSRLDTAFLLFPGYLLTLLAGMHHYTLSDVSKQLVRMREAIVIPVIVVLGFLLCCYLAYGAILPNSFYIKMPGDDAMVRFGLHYLLLYNMLHLYMPILVPFILLYFGLRPDNMPKLGSFSLALLGLVVLWCAYIAYVGGDFMEFRFLVPILPFYYLFIFRAIHVLFGRHKNVISALFFVVFSIGSYYHTAIFRTQPFVLDFNNTPRRFEYAYVESTDSLYDWLRVDKNGWISIGKGLGKLLNTGSPGGVKIALANTGAIPYYSGLPAFDVLGLNSRAVLRNYNGANAMKFDYNMQRPGHNILANDQILLSEKVNLNLGFPHVICQRGNRFVFMNNPVTSFPFARRQTLLVPIGNRCYAVADYITPHPKIEQLLSEKVILRYKDVRFKADCPDWLCLR